MSATLLAVSFGLAIGLLLGLVGAVDHARIGRVQMRTAVACGAAGAVGAVAGTALNRLISGQGLLLAFACAVRAATAMLLPREDPLEQGSNSSLARVGAVGVGAGVLTGFFGIGGGFVILPSVVLP
jgi:hypothetical protein